MGIDPEVNTISFRNITNTGNTTAQISLDKDSYRIGDTGMVTIIDPEGNMDPSEVDIVTAGLETATSRLNIPLGEAYGITIVLHETSASSGVFQGTFNVVSGLSSGSSLQAANGDRITVAYNIPARALISIDSVSESGLLQVTDYLVPQTADFIPFGGAIRVESIDAQLSPGARVNVSLSYANADLQENDPENLRLMQEVEDGVWIDITERDFADNVIGVDTEAKTITGETGSLGSFSIGGDIGTVGGAGGGISRPGTGLVVDFIASIASPLKTGGGGGGGSSTPVPVTPPPPSEVTEVPAGEDNEVVVTVPPDESNSGGSSSIGVREVKLLFQNVTGSGSVTVVTETLGEIAHLFDTSAGFHATVQISEANYTTVGQIYDIAPSSELAFGGVVDVTIPYDESLIATQNEIGKFSEEDVRFLHYNGTSWEDLTIGLNTTTNTVTGRMIGLSPVVAAIIDDGTFGPAYFELYPLAKVSIKEPVVMTDDAATSVRNLTAGQDVTISATLENAQRFDQSYVYIVEIFSPQGHVESIILESGKLEGGEASAISKTWQVLETQAAGTYEIKIIILSSLELPYVLSEVTTLNLDVLAPE